MPCPLPPLTPGALPRPRPHACGHCPFTLHCWPGLFPAAQVFALLFVLYGFFTNQLRHFKLAFVGLAICKPWPACCACPADCACPGLPR